MDKRSLSERDICTQFITPALRAAGWDEITQIREEVSFTKGRIIVRGKLVSRGKGKRADYILSVKPNIPLAIIEAKEQMQAVGAVLQQALGVITAAVGGSRCRWGGGIYRISSVPSGAFLAQNSGEGYLAR